MRKTVVKFGLLAGGIIGALSAVMLPLCMSGAIHFDKSEILGYTAMVLAFLMVFFGIRSYREEQGGGSLTFGKGFQVGILITLVCCAVYVVAWEITYYGFLPDFGEKYSAHMIEQLKAKGATPEKLAAETQRMARFKELYKNPFFNVGMTFLEIFPVGLIVTLVSAGILRRKPLPGGPARAASVA